MNDDWREHLNDPFLPLPDEIDCEICDGKMRVANESEQSSHVFEDHLFKSNKKIEIPTKSRIYVCDNCYARLAKSSRLGEIVTQTVRDYLRVDTA